ncbi:hypothetical protein ONZ51_g6254 [Trametes cubensis]|uniref:Uncharacterized protein n=1 Tax=Trametes cubensis TaxID=1111947 RepID=A0AAD7TSD6_9APHY|nr:hypothetical protein ONZ51_g6254 [Trametes cubensis]
MPSAGYAGLGISRLPHRSLRSRASGSPSLTLLRQLTIDAEQISVLAPINTTKDGQPVIQASFKLAANLPPGEVLQRIREFMGLDEGHQPRLGYRIQPANRNELFLRFETLEDVENAVSAAAARTKRAISRLVQLEITNLDYRPAPAAAPEAGRRDPPPARPVELAYNEELRIVKEKLSCARCSIKGGTPSWCYIDRASTEHIPLQPEHLTLWARCMHDGLCDRECRNPPNCLTLDKLRMEARRKHRRSTSTPKGGSNAAPMPEVHVHIDTPLRNRSNNHRRGHRRKHRRHHRSPSTSSSDAESSSRSTSSSYNSEEDEGEALPISDMLTALHVKQPASNYPAYKETLASKGVLYARSALDFTVDWYIKEVHMPEGLVRPFLRQVELMLKKQRRAGKQSRRHVGQGDENIDPTLR